MTFGKNRLIERARISALGRRAGKAAGRNADPYNGHPGKQPGCVKPGTVTGVMEPPPDLFSAGRKTEPHLLFHDLFPFEDTEEQQSDEP